MESFKRTYAGLRKDIERDILGDAAPVCPKISKYLKIFKNIQKCPKDIQKYKKKNSKNINNIQKYLRYSKNIQVIPKISKIFRKNIQKYPKNI